MLNISWKAGPALGLGQLGHCLGPPPIEKGPKFGSKNCFYFLFYYIYIYIYINWEIEISQNLRRPKELSNARDRDKLNLNK